MLHPENFKKVSQPVIGWIGKYMHEISGYPVKSPVRPGEIYRKIQDHAPENPEQITDILNDLDEIIMPGITHWQHPNFHAYFPANSSVESVLAEFITAALGTQCMIWETSPAAAELEQRMMEWLREAMGIPSSFEGVIQDSASSATLAALITAREVKSGFRSNEEGTPANLRVYCSTEAHSSVEKAVCICGIGRNNLVKIPVDEKMRLVPDILEKQITRDLEEGMLPCAVVAALGTTGTMAVDPLREIGDICVKYGLWLHVDAAYAGSALLLEEYRWMTDGIGNVDSFVFNPHKWMFTNFDCSVYFIKDPDLLIRTFGILPEYLKTATRGQVNDYRDWGVQLGRRFRALKLWFVLRGFGLNGIRERMREHIRLTAYFAEEIRKIKGIELMFEPFLNFVCFRYREAASADSGKVNEASRQLLERINRGGKLFLTHTKIGDNLVIRMVIGQTYVERKHVDLALREIKKAIGEL
jgi:aromatic-L-amino-acid decarboxylase